MTQSGYSDDPARELRELVAAGRFRDALEAYRQAPPLARPVAEVELLAATAATRLGDFATGASLAGVALEHFHARADSDGRMRARNLLGAIAFEQGHLNDAEEHFGQALELARLLNDTRMMANASNNLASVAHLQDREEVALSLYRTAMVSYQRLGDRRGTAQTCHNLGLAFRHQRNWLDAEAAALQAVRHAELVGDDSLRALAVTGRAEIHLERGEVELAEEELRRAEQLSRAADDEVGLAEAGRLQALVALRQGKAAVAAVLAAEARDRAAKFGVAQLQGECAATMALAFRQLNRPEDAEACRAEAEAIFTRLGATLLSRQLAETYPH